MVSLFHPSLRVVHPGDSLYIAVTKFYHKRTTSLSRVTEFNSYKSLQFGCHGNITGHDKTAYWKGLNFCLSPSNECPHFCSENEISAQSRIQIIYCTKYKFWPHNVWGKMNHKPCPVLQLNTAGKRKLKMLMVKWTVNCRTLLFHVSFVRSLAPSRCWLQGACGSKDSFFTGRERLELWSNTSKRVLWYFGGTWTKVQEITVYFIMKQQSYCSLSPKNC